MNNNTHTEALQPTDKRKYNACAKCTGQQLKTIKQLADKCGMTVSNYLLARALNYEPKERLDKEDRDRLDNLIVIRSDYARYLGQLKSMSPERRSVLFNTFTNVRDTANEIQKTLPEVNLLIDAWRKRNPIPQGTSNDVKLNPD
uniref:plasmid mobilization protein n=1 Tax=Bacteroides cellulosilyticus TaxID=246787 RepID=UPI004028FF59